MVIMNAYGLNWFKRESPDGCLRVENVSHGWSSINQPFDKASESDQTGVNRCGEEEPLVLDGELEDEVLICTATEEVIGKPAMVIENRLLFVPEWKEVPGREGTEEDVIQEVVDKNQTAWDHTPYYYS